MRVAVVGLRGMPGVMGGVETHCQELFPRLSKLRPSDEINILMRKAYAARGKKFAGLTLIPLPHMHGKNSEAISSTACGILYSKFYLKADLLHIQGIGPALLAPLARLLGQAVVVTYHSRNYDHAKWSWIGRCALRLGEWAAFRFSDRVIVIADWLGRDVKQRYPAFADKVRVVPNGADHLAAGGADDAAAAAIMKRRGVQRGSFIVCVGRFVPEKGFDVIVDAVERSVHPLKLVICGAADRTDAYSRSLTARASERIIFAGNLDRPCLTALLAQSSLFVLPSYHEGLPIAALEAARVGLPLLLSDIEPNRDLGLPARCYFKAGNVAELCSKLNQPHGTYRVDTGRLTRRFVWDRSAHLLDRIYEEILIKNPSLAVDRSHPIAAPKASLPSD